MVVRTHQDVEEEDAVNDKTFHLNHTVSYLVHDSGQRIGNTVVMRGSTWTTAMSRRIENTIGIKGGTLSIAAFRKVGNTISMKG